MIIDAIKESRRIFQRMNSYAIYRIAETLRVLLFVTLAILIFNFFPLTAVMIVMLALLNDGAILSIAYDNVHYKKQPEAWNMRLVLGIATVLGVVGPIAAFGLFYLGDRGVPPRPRAAPDADVPDALGRRTPDDLPHAHARPVLVDPPGADPPGWPFSARRSLATLIAVYGVFMTPLGWGWAAFVWGYALVWFLLTDRVKLLAYRILDPVKNHGATHAGRRGGAGPVPHAVKPGQEEQQKEESDGRHFAVHDRGRGQLQRRDRGKVSRVIVDPLAEKVTHLVIEPDTGEASAGSSRSTSSTRRSARSGSAAPRRSSRSSIRPRRASSSRQPAATSYGYGPGQVGYWPYYGLGGRHGRWLVGVGGAVGLGGETLSQIVTNDAVPPGEVDVRRGDYVHATDGDIGRVQGLVIDRGSRRVTHVLLQEGHLWGRKDVAIPISAVASTSDGIRLTITKQQVQDLPPVDIDHPDLAGRSAKMGD